MSKSKVAVSLDEIMLGQLDQLVEESISPSRSRAIEIAIQEKLARLNRGRLARECAKFDPKLEKSLTEEGLFENLSEWPEYKR